MAMQTKLGNGPSKHGVWHYDAALLKLTTARKGRKRESMKKFGFWETVWAEARTVATFRTWKCEAGRVFGFGLLGYRHEIFVAVDQERGAIRVI